MDDGLAVPVRRPALTRHAMSIGAAMGGARDDDGSTGNFYLEASQHLKLPSAGHPHVQSLGSTGESRSQDVGGAGRPDKFSRRSTF
ncbi:hypothetical protein DHEL01_v209031 [Diaporthe helianthi]|uniref:Uncharacterized protein n=1 Tax=Diaporthe helianthi TaxID=158607 RepID=A0A2P5HQQ2_DIAHE|nr:hypothetical protein DHEL01_v209031 [Diaporthe helianthi]